MKIVLALLKKSVLQYVISLSCFVSSFLPGGVLAPLGPFASCQALPLPDSAVKDRGAGDNIVTRHVNPLWGRRTDPQLKCKS